MPWKTEVQRCDGKLRVCSQSVGNGPPAGTENHGNKHNVSLNPHSCQSIFSSAVDQCEEQKHGTTWCRAMGHHNEDIPGCFHISNKQHCRHAPLCHTGTHAGMHALKPSIHDFRQFLSYFSWEWTNKRLCCFHLDVHTFSFYWHLTCSQSKTKELHNRPAYDASFLTSRDKCKNPLSIITYRQTHKPLQP